MFFKKYWNQKYVHFLKKVIIDDIVLSNSYSKELSYSAVTLNSASIEKWSALLLWDKDISSRVTWNNRRDDFAKPIWRAPEALHFSLLTSW